MDDQKSEIEGYMILVDNETKVDLLNNEALATTIVKAIRARPDHPVTIGVHGDWGAGKSSVLEMIEAGLKAESTVLCLKFNGWRFQGFEDAKIALIEGIVGGLIEERSLWTKASEATKNILKRLDWLKLARHAGGLAFTAHTGIPLPGQIHSVVKSIESLFHDPTKLASKENVDAVLAGAHGLLKPNTKHIPDEIKAFRKEFDELLKLADIEQLIVLIDDLDRCLPDTAIETLEAVRLFLFTSKTAFVIAADEGMIEYAVRKHFPGLPETTGPVSYARNYLEKLIQIPFRIPALGESETRLYVTLLLTGAELGDDDATFIKLIAKARDLLKRPWQGASLDAATMKSVLGDASFAKAQNALTLSDQIGPILASGTKGNPRQIKRFLNTLMLRKLTAEARGFGEDVHLPVLAKLMLAERFLPRVFDQIATAAAKSPQGKCAELALLEAGESLVGTSSSYKGPGGSTPLIPTWLNEPSGGGEVPPAEPPASPEPQAVPTTDQVVAHCDAPIAGVARSAGNAALVPGAIGSTESRFSWNSVMVNPSGLIVSNCGKMRAWSLTCLGFR